MVLKNNDQIWNWIDLLLRTNLKTIKIEYLQSKIQQRTKMVMNFLYFSTFYSSFTRRDLQNHFDISPSWNFDQAFQKESSNHQTISKEKFGFDKLLANKKIKIQFFFSKYTRSSFFHSQSTFLVCLSLVPLTVFLNLEKEPCLCMFGILKSCFVGISFWFFQKKEIWDLLKKTKFEWKKLEF